MASPTTVGSAVRKTTAVGEVYISAIRDTDMGTATRTAVRDATHGGTRRTAGTTIKVQATIRVVVNVIYG